MIITLWDGRNEPVTEMRDMLYLVDEYMGMDARWWFEDWLKDQEDTEKAYDDLWKDYEAEQKAHKDTIMEIESKVKKLAEIIEYKEFDGKAAENALRDIYHILWRELR